MTVSNVPMNKTEIKALITVFIIGISLPLLATFWNSAGGRFNAEEKRKLAEIPTFHFTREGMNKFPADFALYFADNFGMREKLIRMHSYIKGFFFGVSPTQNAIIGKQGWLFLGDGNIVADYRHTHPFAEEELKRWRDVLVAKRDWLAARGIKYLFVVSPDKHSIYPEFMPDSLNQVRPDSCLDQLVAYLKANSNIEILDVRPALLKGKAITRNYHKTDHHWNAHGAFIAYQEIMQHLSHGLPEIQAKTLADFSMKEEIIEGQDLAIMMGLRNAMHEQDLQLHPKTKLCAQSVDFKLSPDFKWPTYPPGHEAYARECSQGKLKAVFFQDSFGTALVPFISEHFKRTVFIWDYPNYAVMDAAVQQERPDVVIEERVERHLKPMMPDFDIPSGLVGRGAYNYLEMDNKIIAVNEDGNRDQLKVDGKSISALTWQVKPSLSDDGKSLDWGNGTAWTR